MHIQVRNKTFPRQVTIAYCMACYAVFGKTISVIAGEAEADGRWYGATLVIFIDWLLREPEHCANQLVYWRRLNRL